MNTLSTWKRSGKHSNRGYTLIEVLIGIVIFAIGIMALASLQGNLARNSGDSNARTVANNIAEEVIESARTFGQVPPADPPGSADAFADIVSRTDTIERGNINYTVSTVVSDYYYNIDSGTFSETNTDSAAFADMKLLELTVTWNTNQEFQIDASNSTSGRLGSGSITLTDVISSITAPAGGQTSLVNVDSNGYAPPVDYQPGQRPDIISIQLGDSKRFKESTTPLPDIVRAGDLVETRFDVVTYSQADDGATFLRREEFRAVSCECTLHIADGAGEGGLRPTIWDGSRYTKAELVAKPYGESANNQQSDFCSLCCRDHHDGGTGDEEAASDSDIGLARYSPFQSTDRYDNSYAGLGGDHKHYTRDHQGNLGLADSDGDVYLEACRLVRKDGFFRVAQDLRQEGLNNFPASYMDSPEEVSQYSGYVTGAVSGYESTVSGMTLSAYEASPPTLVEAKDMATPLIFPASNYGNATVMEPNSEQQLRSRGIYIDYMSQDLQNKIDCIEDRVVTINCDDIDLPNVTTALEIIPFYDVQLTWLGRWNELPPNVPVDVTNEAIRNDNGHSRGKAKAMAHGRSTVTAAVHKGNLGLTGTDPISPTYGLNIKKKPLYVDSRDPSTPPVLSNIKISGTITSGIPGVRASDVIISATGAQCDRTNTGYVCILVVDAKTPLIEFSNYEKANRLLVACSDDMTYRGSLTGANGWTKYKLPEVTTTGVDIVIMEETDCTLIL